MANSPEEMKVLKEKDKEDTEVRKASLDEASKNLGKGESRKELVQTVTKEPDEENTDIRKETGNEASKKPDKEATKSRIEIVDKIQKKPEEAGTEAMKEILIEVSKEARTEARKEIVEKVTTHPDETEARNEVVVKVPKDPDDGETEMRTLTSPYPMRSSVSVIKNETSETQYRTVFMANHFITMFKDLHELQKNGKYCDTVIWGHNGCVLSHKLVLVVASNRFQALCRLQQTGLFYINLTDIAVELIELLIVFLYTSTLKVNEYQLPGFLQLCERVGMIELASELKSAGVDINQSFLDVGNVKQEVMETDDMAGDINHDNGEADKVEDSGSDTDAVDLQVNDSDSDSVISFDGEKEAAKKETKLVSKTKEEKGKKEESAKTRLEARNAARELRSRYLMRMNYRGRKPRAPEVKGSTKKEVRKPCSTCSKVFSTKANLDAHSRQCKVARPNKPCMLCNKEFATNEEYAKHRASDPECLVLQKEKYKRKMEVKRERRRKFACRVCTRKFRKISDQVEHEFVAHEIMYDKKEYPDLTCEVCSVFCTCMLIFMRKNEMCLKPDSTVDDVRLNSTTLLRKGFIHSVACNVFLLFSITRLVIISVACFNRLNSTKNSKRIFFQQNC